MKQTFAFLLLLGIVSTFAACGGSTTCTTPGVTSECDTGEVCQTDVDGTVCLTICTDDSDCDSDEKCSGGSGDLKSCQPTS